MKNPYPETTIDEATGEDIPCDKHIFWQEGYQAGDKDGYSRRSKELELVAEQLRQTAAEMDAGLAELRRMTVGRN